MRPSVAALFTLAVLAVMVPKWPAWAGNPVEGKVTWTCTGPVSNCGSPNSTALMGCKSATGTGESKGAAYDAGFADCTSQLSSAPNGPWSCEGGSFKATCSKD